MSVNPSTQWFWNDWDNDQGLRLCSLAAQGLWMRMLSIAARSTPLGYVAVNGVACTDGDLSALIGIPVSEISPLREELEMRGVLSRNRDGTCYNRRMIRDTKVSERNRKNGRLGGLASVEKQRGIFKSPKRSPKPPAQAVASSGGLSENTPNSAISDPSQPIEDTNEISSRPSPLFLRKKEEGSPPYKSPPQTLAAFSEWYDRYPHKIGRRKAEASYRTALGRATPEQLSDGLARYIETKPIDIAWCNPATWLNQDRWLDQPQHINEGNGHAKSSAADSLIRGFGFAAGLRTPDREPDSRPLAPLLGRRDE